MVTFMVRALAEWIKFVSEHYDTSNLSQNLNYVLQKKIDLKVTLKFILGRIRQQTWSRGQVLPLTWRDKESEGHDVFTHVAHLV